MAGPEVVAESAPGEQLRRGDIMPTRPDIDNVIKIILDGMNEAAYLDDQQVHMISAEKRYGDLARVEIRLNW